MLPLNYTMTRALREDREREIAALQIVGHRYDVIQPLRSPRHWLACARRNLDQAGHPRASVRAPEMIRSYRTG